MHKTNRAAIAAIQRFIGTLAFAALLAAGPIAGASASIIRMEISGVLDCSSQVPEWLGVCRNPEGFSAATGFPVIYGPGGYWYVSGPFSMLFSIDTDAPPNSTAVGFVTIGDLSFAAETTLEPAATTWCSGPGTRIHVKDLDPKLFGSAVLCSSAVNVDDWLDVVALSDTELASFRGGFGEFDQWLYGVSGDRWGVAWGARTIAKVPEPTALALLSLGIAGLAFTRRGKQ